MKYDAVFFDLDNTLFDYEITFEKTMCFSFEKLKRQFTWKISANDWFPQFKKYCDILWDDYELGSLSKTEYRRNRFLKSLGSFNIRAPVTTADLLQEIFNQQVGNFVTPYEGLYDLLSLLNENKVLVGVITNGQTDVQYRKIHSLNLQNYIEKEYIFISEACGIEKPDPNIFKYVQLKIGREMTSPIYIGDTWELDIFPALKANWNAGYVGEQKEHQLTAEVAFMTYNLLEVKAFL
jgi:5'-nucleotidase